MPENQITKICPNCMKDITEESVICPFCNLPLSPAQPDRVRLTEAAVIPQTSYPNKQISKETAVVSMFGIFVIIVTQCATYFE